MSFAKVLLVVLHFQMACVLQPIEYYIQQFKEEQLLHDRIYQNNFSLHYSFNNFSDDIVGYCILSGDVHNMEIDTKFWNRATDLEREQLVYHELGHCLLGRMEHTEGSIMYGFDLIPKSIMKCCGFIEDKIYKKYHKYYMNELFNKE